MGNVEVQLTLREAVAEVFAILTGLDLEYAPEQERFASITRALNRATRAHALEREWSFYSDVEEVGAAVAGENRVRLRSSLRLRAIGDDQVRLTYNGVPVVWAAILPRDALHKYRADAGLWCAMTRQEVIFSRPFFEGEDGLIVEVPVMREPRMFRLPDQPEDPEAPLVEVPDAILDQTIDYDFPDIIVLRAAYYYAQTDPVMQPRVQTLEAQYKDLMYQLIARDEAFTAPTRLNDWSLGIGNGLNGPGGGGLHFHPHAAGGRI